ncbi:hypothetical protein JTF60_gp02 [Microbacterium phage Efeko]|uniref:Uncharacterized protein n=1 Tax=Microbacterium phage Efeko TaxID=2315704 RepID=A0A386KMT7_9CAUD|nr:hypothetical protein JTF60_gp02 [Microbacterium phage Efeko]AYD86249.1 hypothetical protein SEA_EFEKO_2 [Microbacterium phage Efeko]
MTEIRCTCPSGDGSLRWPCPEHPPTPAELGELQRAAEQLAAAFAELQRVLVELLLPTFEAFARMVEQLAELVEDSRPVRWLNRRARRAAMRRHPAGRRTSVQLDVADRAGQPDAGSYPSAAELAARAGIRLPATLGDVELHAPAVSRVL